MSQNKYPGVGVLDNLQLLFIALKLTGHITWSWWWVMSPIWITLIVAVCVGLTILCMRIWLKR